MEQTWITFREMQEKIKEKLEIQDTKYDIQIEDLMAEVCDYCNLESKEMPEQLEPYVRKKLKAIMDYEEVNGTGYHQDISSIREGDGTVTYATGSGNTRDAIYHWTGSEKNGLRKYRRLRK